MHISAKQLSIFKKYLIN